MSHSVPFASDSLDCCHRGISCDVDNHVGAFITVYKFRAVDADQPLYNGLPSPPFSARVRAAPDTVDTYGESAAKNRQSRCAHSPA